MSRAKNARHGPRREDDRASSVRQAATADTQPEAPLAAVTAENVYGIPRRLLRTLLVIIAVLGLVMLFRDLLEDSFTGLIRMARSDKPMTLLEAAPRLGLLLGRKPASVEEFAAVCRHARPEDALAALTALPAPVLEHGLLLHALVEHTDNHAVLSRLLWPGSPLRARVNARDATGRTPLHLAARKADPLFLLILRNAGAEPHVYDAAGVSPLAELLAAPDKTVARHAEPLIREGMDLGYPPPPKPKARQTDAHSPPIGHIPEAAVIRWLLELIARLDDRSPGFFTLSEQMQTRADKDYVAILAAALKTLRGSGAPDTLVPVRDLPVPPPTEMERHYMNSLSPAPPTLDSLVQTEYKGPGEWRWLQLQEGTGPRMAAVKCLLPEARSASLNWLSALAAGQPSKEPPLELEWKAWDLPPETIVALTVSIFGKNKNQADDRFARLQRDQNARIRQRSLKALLRFRDEMEQRHPPLLTCQLLDAASRDSLRAWQEERTKTWGKDKKDDGLDALCAVRLELPDAAWRAVGSHLTAAAYLKKIHATRAATRPPGWCRRQTSYEPLRTWNARPLERQPQAGDRDRAMEDFPAARNVIETGLSDGGRHRAPQPERDPGEPLVAVARILGQVSPETGQRLLRLMLDAGARPGQPDRHGVLPLDAARAANAPPEVLRLLAPAPAANSPTVRK